MAEWNKFIFAFLSKKLLSTPCHPFTDHRVWKLACLSKCNSNMDFQYNNK